MGLFIVVLMIMSVFGVMLYGQNDTASSVSESGYDFIAREEQGLQVWQTEIAGDTASFLYLPSQTESVSAEFNRATLHEPLLILAFDPTQQDLEIIDYARARFAEDLQQNTQSSGTAVTVESSAYDIPLLNCSEDSAVVFRYGNQTSISQDGSCVVVQGEDPRSFLVALERLRYIYYGVA